MKRHLSTLALSALAVAAVGGLTVLRTGLVVEAAWRHDYTPLTGEYLPCQRELYRHFGHGLLCRRFSSGSPGTARSAS